MSETNAKIAAALVKAQKAFSPALKANTNPHFKSKYADLSACIEAVIDSLNENGIALVQRTHESDSGVAVETVFIHESGEQFSGGILRVPAVKNDAQGYGSALTYARRYSLMAACGHAPEDDDGNAAAKGKQPPQSSKSAARDAHDNQSPAMQSKLEDWRVAVMDGFEESDEAGMAKYVEAKATLSADAQVAFWHLFDSTTRANIKALGTRKEAA